VSSPLETNLSPARKAVLRRAMVLEWVSIAFLTSIIVVMYLAMGNSQAMKTAFWEDLLSLVPPIVFLVGVHVERKPRSRDYPYGHLNVETIAFLASSTALLLMGGSLLIDAVSSLLSRHHPSIGAVEIGGRAVWSGWVMIAAVTYSVIPPIVLGRLKMGPARALHDKTLAADADMNKADWMTGLATGVGVLGIGVGWWWADAAAAAFVSFEILKDGAKNLTRAIRDLMDHVPTDLDGEPLEVTERAEAVLRGLPWVGDVRVRCRQEGRFVLVEAEIAPRPDHGTPDEIAAAQEAIRALDWKVAHVLLSPTLTHP
jgi:cation diffusion facilitator family transporter